jgi:phage shock protein A
MTQALYAHMNNKIKKKENMQKQLNEYQENMDKKLRDTETTE